jgi:hypothetical protein
MPGPTAKPPKPLPPVPADRLYGYSGYTGADAKELARHAAAARPVELTEELFFTVCDRLIQGEPLVLICADRTMPSRPQLMRYMFKNEKARETYYAAREMQCETLAEEALLIAVDDSNDFSVETRVGKGGQEYQQRVSHNDVVQRARLKIDQLNRTMAKMAPRRFGDKNVTEIQGNPNQPVALQIITGVPRNEHSLIRGELVAPKIIEAAAAETKGDGDA